MRVDARQKSERPIRSFVLRSGRMTAEKKADTSLLYSKYCISVDEPFNYDEIFGRIAPVVVEIGFGMGHSLIEMAARRPEANFIGIEVHPPGVARVLAEIQRLGLSNLRVIRHDAVDVLSRCIPPGTLDEIWLLFPDPWPKNRHHKRRIVQPDFINLVTQCLRPEGSWHLATDWAPYAQWMVDRLEMTPSLANTAGPGQTITEDQRARITTKFERRGKGLGYKIHEYHYRKR